MHVASLELCKELYELSGWEADDVWSLVAKDWEQEMIAGSINSTKKEDGSWLVDKPIEVEKEYRPCLKMGQKYIAPAYDLGHLLRKLPARVGGRFNAAYLRMSKVRGGVGTYAFAYMSPDLTWTHENIADTPEDAAARLAVELFKQGVLKRGD